MALYVDLKTVYVSLKDFNFSHVQRVCKKLGIRIIKVYSAQAKGRVERKHAIYQDRFVKELNLKNIKDEKAANELLDNGFIEKLPRNPESANRPLNGIDLNQILCWEYERQVQNDWTFSYNNQCYQIEKKCPLVVRPKTKICIREHLDGSVTVWHQSKNLSVSILVKRPPIIADHRPVLNMSERGSMGAKIGKPRSP